MEIVAGLQRLCNPARILEPGKSARVWENIPQEWNDASNSRESSEEALFASLFPISYNDAIQIKND